MTGIRDNADGAGIEPRRYALRSPLPPATSRLDLSGALNDEQRAAVEAEDRRILILAGAGTGKTRTLTYRVARLIEKGALPSSIVLVTFTRRAAREMIDRIDALLGPAARMVRAGTFHRLAHRWLEREGAAVGLRPGFSILDGDDQRSVMSAAIDDLGLDKHKSRALRAETLVAIRSLAVNTAGTVRHVIDARFPHLGGLAGDVEAAIDAFAKKKAAMHAADFDDLLHALLQLLADGAVGPRIRSEIAHVLVDEYQDTSRVQADIAERLAGDRGRLCVVGDDAQAIYRFRGATTDGIARFAGDARGAAIYKLTASYRSTPRVLGVANRILAASGRHMDKPLSSSRGAGPLPVVIPARDPFQQAEFIAQRTLELEGEGVPLSEQAVLYRAHSHSIELELELAKRRIPYVVRAGARFFEQAHVKDVLAHLRVLANARDEIAWRRVLSIQRGVGAQSARRVVGRLGEELERAPDAFASDLLSLESTVAELPSRGRAAIGDLAARLREVRAAGERQGVGAMIRSIVRAGETGGYAEHLELTYGDGRQRREELDRLADIADGSSDLGSFLSEVALADEALGGEDAGGAGPGERERLVLTTIHQAKGLEWNAVFVAGLCEGWFPHQSALEEDGGEEEERRLLYVAVTRAREHLYLCSPCSRVVKGGDRVLLRPSRFLSEIETSPTGALTERWALDGA